MERETEPRRSRRSLTEVEITENDIQRSGVRYSYRDGFRLGFGFTIGTATVLLIIGAISWVLTTIFKIGS